MLLFHLTELMRWVIKWGDKVGDKVGDKSKSNDLSISQIKVLAEIRNNPNITKPQLMIKCELGKTC